MKKICLTIVSTVIFLVVSPYAFNKIQLENHAPVVKIILPKNNSAYAANTQIRYAISVSDKEDGESKYDEIPTNEVILKVKYVADSSKALAELTNEKQNDPEGLNAIKTSNCFNCHAFNTKVIGPSFSDISKRYLSSPENIALLSKRILEGSKDVWGNVPMPTHPELSKETAQKMVEWILKNAVQKNVTYYSGTEGSVKLTVQAENKPGAFIFTASYTDHGMKDKPNQKLEGSDAVIVRIK